MLHYGSVNNLDMDDQHITLMDGILLYKHNEKIMPKHDIPLQQILDLVRR